VADPTPPLTQAPHSAAESETETMPEREDGSAYEAVPVFGALSAATAVDAPLPQEDENDTVSGAKTARAEGESSGPETLDTAPIRGAAITQPVAPEQAPSATLAPPQGQGAAPVDSTSWLDLEYGPESKPEPHRPASPLRSGSRLKVYGLVALSLLVVGALVAGGLLLFAKSPTPAGQLHATQNGPSSGVTGPSHTATTINTGTLTQYQGYAEALQTANLAAASGFRQAPTPTTEALALDVIQYSKALTSYNNGLESISWPPSMRSIVQADHSQLLALMSFLRSFSIVQPAGVSAWLVQLHGRTSNAESADNQVRRDLGLPTTTAFP
jgi:hypothetical protein